MDCVGRLVKRLNVDPHHATMVHAPRQSHQRAIDGRQSATRAPRENEVIALVGDRAASGTSLVSACSWEAFEVNGTTRLVPIAKEHWLGWLGEYEGRGAYDRKNWHRSAQFIYNHIGCPAMLVWLAEACGLPRKQVSTAAGQLRDRMRPICA